MKNVRRQLQHLWLGISLALAYTPDVSAADFYQGKQINIVVGFTAGGGYDVSARLYSRWLGRHLAGNPTVIVSNMPGAGSVVAASSLYNGAPQDGTRLGVIAGGAVIEPLVGEKKSLYDPRSFQWIGGRTAEPSVCAIWHTSPVHSLEDVMKRETAVGASGPGSRTVTYPRILNELVGTRFKVVSGYPGGNEIGLAMERGEVEGHCGLAWSSAKAHTDWIQEGKIRMIAQFGLSRAPDLLNVPLAGEFAKTPADRQAIEFLESDAVLAWPLMAPPGVPADRVQELREAFKAMTEDPGFLSDAANQGLDVQLVLGSQMQKVVEDLYQTPSAVLDMVKHTMSE